MANINTQPIYHDPVWQFLCRIASNKELMVSLKPLVNKPRELVTGGDNGTTVIINKNLSNRIKLAALLSKLIYWVDMRKLVKKLEIGEVNEDEINYLYEKIKTSNKYLFEEVQKEVN